jgi:uncharacterized RDD family membrane protein YckC
MSYGSGAVVTPEAVRLDFEAAGVGSRALAFLIDSFIVMMMLLLLSLSVALAAPALGDFGTAATVVLIVTVFLLTFGYPVAFETLWRGRTPGKAALGLRVVTVEGAPVRFRHAVVRAALGLIDFFFFFGTPAVITALLTKRNQRLGDLVAGTMVLRQRVASTPARAATFAAPPGMDSYAATLDVSGVTPADYATLRSFLLRATSLDPDIRDRLAAKIATALAAKIAHTPPPNVTVQQFLVALAARYQQRSAAPTTAPPVTAPAAEAPTYGDFAPPA